MFPGEKYVSKAFAYVSALSLSTQLNWIRDNEEIEGFFGLLKFHFTRHKGPNYKSKVAISLKEVENRNILEHDILQKCDTREEKKTKEKF